MMSPYTALCSHLLFPIHEHLKGHDSVALRHRLEQSQWWSLEEIEGLQARKLKHFLMTIGESVPYYQILFKKLGFDPARVLTTEALQQLPLLSKADVRANTQALKATQHGPLSRYNTGGSSGEPLIFYIGKARKSHDVAAKWRATRWWGLDVGDPEMVVWGSPIELGAQDHLRRLRDTLMRSHLLPAFEISEANLKRFLQAIRKTRPAMLFGYPSSLHLIAQHAQAHGLAMDDLGIQVAFVTSEKLYDEQRARIGEVFGCQVANGYGARDAGFIAHECPAGSMHISAEDIIVETLGVDGTPVAPGEAGEIVVTHLSTAEFPFVRYRTGDIGALAQKACACGRGLPVLTEVQGRSTDFVVAQDGTVMHGLALVYTVRDLPGVERFKIEQTSLDQTVVKVVGNTDFGEAQIARIIFDFKARLGQGVDICVERLAVLPNEPSGKFRYVVSRVDAFCAGQGAAHA
jgi:phenylacetate-CoA ligase